MNKKVGMVTSLCSWITSYFIWLVSIRPYYRLLQKQNHFIFVLYPWILGTRKSRSVTRSPSRATRVTMLGSCTLYYISIVYTMKGLYVFILAGNGNGISARYQRNQDQDPISFPNVVHKSVLFHVKICEQLRNLNIIILLRFISWRLD